MNPANRSHDACSLFITTTVLSTQRSFLITSVIPQSVLTPVALMIMRHHLPPRLASRT